MRTRTAFLALAALLALSALTASAYDFVIIYKMTPEAIQTAVETWPVPIDEASAKDNCAAYYTNFCHKIGQMIGTGEQFKPSSGPRAGQKVYPTEKTLTRFEFIHTREVITNTVAGDIVCGWCFDIKTTWHVVSTQTTYPYNVTETDATESNETIAVPAGVPRPSIYGFFIENTGGNVDPQTAFETVISHTVRGEVTSNFYFPTDAAWGKFTATISDPYYRLKRLAAKEGLAVTSSTAADTVTGGAQ